MSQINTSSKPTPTLPSKPAPLQPTGAVLGTVKAIFNYEAQDPTCLSLEKGDIIELIEVPEGPWWKGKLKNVVGWFPSNFVQSVDEDLVIPVTAGEGPKNVGYRSSTLQVRTNRKSLPNGTVSVQKSLEDPSIHKRTKTFERPKTQAVHAPVVEKAEAEITFYEQAKYFLERDGSGIILFILYMIANVVYFAVTYSTYSNVQDFQLLDNGLPMARATGALLKLNCAFIFFPVCRTALTWLHGQPLFETILPLDSNIKIHKYIAYWIWILGTTHSISHIFNFNKMSKVDLETFRIYFPDLTKYNSFGEWLFYTIPGSTGVIIWICQMLIFSSALQNVRRLGFEVFWYTHHLFIIFTLMLLIHGTAAIFEAPGYWKFFLFPGCLYIVERMSRLFRGTQPLTVDHVTGENAGVLAIYMVRKEFPYRAGEYLFLNCPAVSQYEWHPFTITSCPEEKYLSVHIKAVGGWTKKLHKLLNPSSKSGDIDINKSFDDQNRPLLRVDGPFGAPSEHAFEHNVVVLVGMGIGVTPYAAILKSMFYKVLLEQNAPKEYHLELLRVKKVHFYWVCRERSSVEWFAYLLRDLEERAPEFLEVHTYITERFKLAEIESYVQKVKNEAESDPFTGLKSRTHFGRPDFDKIFNDMTEIYPEERIGVFFCGPKVVGKNIKEAAKANSKPLKTQFVFRKENF